MGEQSEGRNAKYVLIEQSDMQTKPTSPATGFVLPFTTTDLTPGDGFFDFEEIDGVTTPSKPMDARHAPAGRITTPLHWDSIGWIFKHAIGIPTTTLAGPYLHAYELGHANGEYEALAIERQQSDQTKNSRLFWGGRVSQFTMTAALEGAVMFDSALEFIRNDDWATGLVSTSPTSYTLDPIDEMIGIIKVGGSQEEYFAGFSLVIDWQLSADRYPVYNNGWRHSLARGKPRLSGTIDAYLSNDTMTDLIDAAAAGTPVDIDIEFVETAVTAELKIDLNDILLKQTGEPVDTMAGVNCQFDWRGYGATCCVFNLYNSVASY